MWETINDLGKNPLVLLFVTGVFITIIYCIKKGYFKFNAKGVQIGLSEQQTRNLIQSQFEFAKAKCEGMVTRIPQNGLDPYRTKYIVSRVEDVIQRAIIFNNLTDNEEYIRGKQELVYQTVMARVDKDYFKTPDFKALIYKFTDELFKELYRMKRVSQQHD